MIPPRRDKTFDPTPFIAMGSGEGRGLQGGKGEDTVDRGNLYRDRDTTEAGPSGGVTGGLGNWCTGRRVDSDTRASVHVPRTVDSGIFGSPVSARHVARGHFGTSVSVRGNRPFVARRPRVSVQSRVRTGFAGWPVRRAVDPWIDSLGPPRGGGGRAEGGRGAVSG